MVVVHISRIEYSLEGFGASSVYGSHAAIHREQRGGEGNLALELEYEYSVFSALY